MKRGIAVLTKATLAWLVLSFFCLMSVTVPPLSAAEPIRIGVVLSITGGAGFLGTPEKMAITAPVEGLPTPKEGFSDAKSSSTSRTTRAILRRHRRRDEAHPRQEGLPVIGPSTAEAATSVIPICEREKVPELPMAPFTMALKKWIFLVPITDRVLSDKMVAFTAKTLGAKRIALRTDSGRYGLSGADGVKAAVDKYGATVVIQERCEQEDTNMIPQLSKIKAANPDAIVLFTPLRWQPPSPRITNSSALQKIPVICGGGVPSKEFPKLAGDVVEDGRWIPFDLWTSTPSSFLSPILSARTSTIPSSSP